MAVKHKDNDEESLLFTIENQEKESFIQIILYSQVVLRKYYEVMVVLC